YEDSILDVTGNGKEDLQFATGTNTQFGGTVNFTDTNVRLWGTALYQYFPNNDFAASGMNSSAAFAGEGVLTAVNTRIDVVDGVMYGAGDGTTASTNPGLPETSIEDLNWNILTVEKTANLTDSDIYAGDMYILGKTFTMNGGSLNLEGSTYRTQDGGGVQTTSGLLSIAPEAQFIVNGEATLKIGSLNGTIVLNDEAVLSADTSITGSMGSLRAVDADIVAGGTYNTVTFEVDGILNVTGVDLTDVYTVGSNSSISLEEGGVLAFNESNVVWDDETTGTILSEGIIYSVTAIDDPISYGYGLESFAFAATEEVYTALKGDLTVTQGEGTYTFTAAFATTGGAGEVLYEIDSIRVGETDLEEGVDYTVDGMSFTLKNNGPADLVITVEAEDQYGEASEINGSVTLAVKDYTDPVFASALTPDTTEQAESVTFVASEVADNFGVVSYSYTFNGETKEWKAGESVTVTENGLFTVLAKDAAGNTATQTYEVTNIVIPEVPVIPEEPVVPVAPSGPVNVLVVTPGNTHEYHGEDVVMPEGQSIAAILNTKSEAMNLEVGVLGKAGEGVTDLMLGYGVNMEIQKEFQNPGSINIGFNSSLKVEGNVSAEGSFKSLMVGSGSSVEVNGDVSGYSFLSAGTNGSFVADNVTGTASGMDLFSAGYGAEVDVKDISGVGTLVFGGNNDVYAGDISGVRNMILGYGSELDAGTVQFDGDYSMLALAGNNFVSVEELDGLKNLFVGSGSKIEFVYNGEEDLDLSGIAGNWDFAELEDCRGVLAGGSVEGATYGNELDTFVASGSLSFEFDSESTKVMYAAWNEAEEDFSDWTVLESGATLADGDYLIGAASLDGKGKTKGNYSFDVTIA
ncbi:MAG: hypothetical protein J6S98_10700, partial [Lentisphaeria bacterium]|nr:hypothetical protein [Lentisphaeria bacterium]